MTVPKRPEAGVPRAYAFPGSDRHVLANGMTVITAPLRRLPVVTVLAIVDAGGESDALSQAGLGALTAKALSEGTRQRSGDALADAFESLGGELFTDAGWTRAECGITVLGARLEPTLHLVAEVLREPAFREQDVMRLRAERLAELLQIEAEPRGLADDQFLRIAFGPATRYAEPVAGSTASVAGLSTDDVRRHFKERYLPANVTLIIVGDVDGAEAMKLSERIFDEWKPDRPTRAPDPGKATRSRRAVHVVHRADAPQTELRVGHPSVPRSHPEFHAMSVMNAILGGLFNSRINLNLRERHAFTYGAFSSFDWRREASLFEVSTAVRSDVTAAALTEILNEIDRIRAADVSESELSLARDYLTGVFPIRFETTAAIADALATRESFRLEETYYDQYRSRISAVSVADVKRVAEQILDPSSLQILAVGDPGMIRGPIEALELGEVHQVAAEQASPTSMITA